MHPAIFNNETNLIPLVEEVERLKGMTLGYMINGPSEQYSITDLKKVGILIYRKDWITLDSLLNEGLVQVDILRIPMKDTGYSQATETKKMYSVTDDGKRYFEATFINKKSA